MAPEPSISGPQRGEYSQTARDEFIEAEPEFMLMWTRMQDHAAQRVIEDPELAAESISAQLGITPAVALDQMSGYTYLTAEDLAGEEWMGGGAAESIASTAEFLAQVRQSTGAHSPEHYAERVYGDAVQEVAE